MLVTRVQIKKDIQIFLHKEKNLLIFKGPLGYSIFKYNKNLFIRKSFSQDILVGYVYKHSNTLGLLGTMKSLIIQQMLGVSQGFFQIINIIGVG
jgi:ribosomal protein L6P/L9E